MKLRMFLSLFFACATVTCCEAQNTYIDQMVQDNINLRRKEEIYKSRRTQAAQARSANKATTRKSAIRSATVDIAPDMYDNFFQTNKGGFAIEFLLTGSDGKRITRHSNLIENENVKITGVPAGSYAVSARSTGRRLLLATEIGEPSNPRGGNFGASQRITIASGKDYYGNAVMVSTPGTLWLRVL